MMKNSEKNAALERRLRADDIPAPPPHLRDRLKNQIPDSFSYAARGGRPSWQSVWAIAASLFLLVNVTYFGLRFLTGDIPAAGERTASVRQAPPKIAEIPSLAAPAPPAASRAMDQSDELVSQSKLPASPTSPDASLSKAASSASLERKDSVTRERTAAKKEQDREQQEDAVEKIAVNEEIPDLESATESRDTVARSRAEERKNDARTEALGSKAAPTGAPAMATAGRMAETVTIMAAAPAPPPPAAPAAQPSPRWESFPNPHGAAFVDTFARRRSSFGLNPGDSSYVEARRLLSQRRMPRSIEIEKFVNHFRYGDLVPDTEDFSLRSEGTVVPLLPAGRETVFLRFGIQGRENRPGEESQNAIVARNARVDVVFNPGVVARFRLLGYDKATAGRASTSIQSGHAVSALYEVELRPGAPSAAAVARMILTYDDSLGQRRSVTTSLHQRDIASSWSQAAVSMKVSVMAATIAEGMRDRNTNKLEVASSLVKELAETAPESDASELLKFLELLRRVMPF